MLFISDEHLVINMASTGSWADFAKNLWTSWTSNSQIPGTDRHIKNFFLQRNSVVDQETHTRDIGNGKIVTVTINDVIRKSGRPKLEVRAVCSDGRSDQLVRGKNVQLDKMKVVDDLVQSFM